MDVPKYENNNVGTLMSRESNVEDTIVEVSPNLHLNLSAKEIEIISAYNRERRLVKAIAPVLPDHDYVLIDNPPSMGIFPVNSLTASDYVLIPLELSYFGVIGMQLMFNLMHMIREETNENLTLMGLVPNKFTRQTKVPQMRLRELINTYPDAPILTTIPKAVALEKARGEGMNIFEYTKSSKPKKVNEREDLKTKKKQKTLYLSLDINKKLIELYGDEGRRQSVIVEDAVNLYYYLRLALGEKKFEELMSAIRREDPEFLREYMGKFRL